MTTLRRLIAKALEITTPTVEGCARDLGLSSSALRRYRLGNRKPTAELIRKLAALLRWRAAAMMRLADQLEATITDQEVKDG